MTSESRHVSNGSIILTVPSTVFFKKIGKQFIRDVFPLPIYMQREDLSSLPTIQYRIFFCLLSFQSIKSYFPNFFVPFSVYLQTFSVLLFQIKFLNATYNYSSSYRYSYKLQVILCFYSTPPNVPFII